MPHWHPDVPRCFLFGLLLLLTEDDVGAYASVVAVAPIFATPAEKSANSEMLPGVFRWLKPFGAKRTCLFGLHLDPLASITAPASVRVAAFDLDGTLIVSPFDKSKGKAKGKGGGGALSGSGGFEWWKAVVPKKLEEVKEQGYLSVERCDVAGAGHDLQIRDRINFKPESDGKEYGQVQGTTTTRC